MQPASSAGRRPAVPVYLKIRNAIRDAISNAAYAPGDLLPSETELAKRYATTRATVVHAIQQLVFEGLVERKRGVGSFVAQPKLSSTVDTHRVAYFEQDAFARDLTYEVISYGKAVVEDHVRDTLRLGRGEPVYRLQRLRLLSGKPIAFELRYLPALVGARLTAEMLARRSVQSLLDEEAGMPITRFLNAVRVALVPAAVARHLQLEKGRPVMVRTHTFLDAADTPLLWGETLYREEYQINYVLTAMEAPDEAVGGRPRKGAGRA
ncbi:probable GntR-family transcriptional regulator [Bordetella bronchiseptica MO149]|uniref:GntR family transcriptional regulator n=1 Tax=Bordetella bronchiseptica TaxID=518 RepID=UPI00028B5C95|nr:GntR family transcriptional regulator [Bordetella bronchiseptica]AUL17183.1 GntR family transcriptional regulator [Bordetella bronchiseptica]AWP60416.1 GntR family transcriptional regulator [Bordetella bronchiseptica]AZW32695.1 GntR family transcriptional regulator [Bordetella bronchiseptica]CCJ60768.1 probable GntR-family transcriptional regulator [Bordetella bronchiseptica MO149]